MGGKERETKIVSPLQVLGGLSKLVLKKDFMKVVV